MRLVEIAFFTESVEDLANFYRRATGATVEYQSNEIAILLSGQVKILIHQNYVPSDSDLPPENHIAFSVNDLDAACAGLMAEKFEIEFPPKDYEWGRCAYLRDPDGHLVELIQD